MLKPDLQGHLAVKMTSYKETSGGMKIEPHYRTYPYASLS